MEQQRILQLTEANNEATAVATAMAEERARLEQAAQEETAKVTELRAQQET